MKLRIVPNRRNWMVTTAVPPGIDELWSRCNQDYPVVAMRTTAFCEGCHQFNFPGDSGPGGELFATDEPMQDTHAEWAMSRAAATK